MNKSKLSQYKLNGFVHTVCYHSDSDTWLPGDKSVSRVRDQPGVWAHTNNPNSVATCYDLDSLLQALDKITGGTYQLVRVDFALDSIVPGDFQKFAKLNKYLVALITNAYKISNAYDTRSLIELQPLSACAKNSWIEIENYDKKAESNGKSGTTSRLELRSKRWNGQSIQREYGEVWAKRLQKAISPENILETNARYNRALAENFQEGMNLKSYVIQNQNCIFTGKQLQELLAEIGRGDGDVSKRASNLKAKAGIELYSRADLQYAVAEIQRAIHAFIDTETASVRSNLEVRSA